MEHLSTSMTSSLTTSTTLIINCYAEVRQVVAKAADAGIEFAKQNDIELLTHSDSSGNYLELI